MTDHDDIETHVTLACHPCETGAAPHEYVREGTGHVACQMCGALAPEAVRP